MQQKQVIRDCYSQLFSKNCKMIQTFTLHNQLNDLAMRMRPVNLDDPDIYFDDCLDDEDKSALGLTSFRRSSIVEEEEEVNEEEDEGAKEKEEKQPSNVGGSPKAGGKAATSFQNRSTLAQKINPPPKLDQRTSGGHSPLRTSSKSPNLAIRGGLTIQSDAPESAALASDTKRSQVNQESASPVSPKRCGLGPNAQQASQLIKLKKGPVMQIRLDVGQLFVILKGKVRVERVVKGQEDLDDKEGMVNPNDDDEVVNGEDQKLDGHGQEEATTPTMRRLNLPRISFLNRNVDSPSKRHPDSRNMNLSYQQSSIEDMLAQDCPQDQIVSAMRSGWETQRSVDMSKGENKNSFMRMESAALRRINFLDNWIQKTKQKAQGSNSPTLFKNRLETKIEYLKDLLSATCFLSEYTQHSNPQLQANMQRDELQWKFNSTVSEVHNLFRKNFIIKEYERLVEEEKYKIEAMVAQSEQNGARNAEDANILPEGSFINSYTMLNPATYLQDYMLTYDGTVPEDQLPIIATISQKEFKESLLHTDDQAVESIIHFSQQIPGFGQMDRSISKRLFYLFTKLKVQKGWKMQSQCDTAEQKKLPPPSEGRLGSLQNTPGGASEMSPDDEDDLPKLYIILNGQFGFKSLNKKMQPSVMKQAAKANVTTLTAIKGRKGHSKGGSSINGSNKLIMRKFLNLRDATEAPTITVEGFTDNQPITSARAKVSIEDKKHIKQSEQRINANDENIIEDRVRRLLLCKGQIFGEDECLKHIIDFTSADLSVPIDMHYTVTCESNNAELLVANIEDIYKVIKTESKVVKFMKEQFVQKFPSEKPADDFFKGVFSGKVQEGASGNQKGQQQHQQQPQQRDLLENNQNSVHSDEEQTACKSQMRTQNVSPLQSAMDTERESHFQVPVTKPLMKNLMEYGMQDKVPQILLNQNQVDFRDTIGEIVKDFPFSKVQQIENKKSQMNLFRASKTQDPFNKREVSKIGRISTHSFSKDMNPLTAVKQKDGRLRTADQQAPNLEAGIEGQQRPSQTRGYSEGPMGALQSTKPHSLMSQLPNRFNNKAYMNSKIDQVISEQMGQSYHNFIPKGGIKQLPKFSSMSGPHSVQHSRAMSPSRNNFKTTYGMTDPAKSKYASLQNSKFQNQMLPSLENSQSIFESLDKSPVNKSAAFPQPQNNSRLALLESILHPQYKKYKVAQTIGRPKLKPQTHQASRKEIIPLQQPRSLPQKKFAPAPVVPLLAPEPEDEFDVDKIGNEIMDTYAGLHSILGRLVNNRVLIEKRKRQEKATGILDKVKDNLQMSHISQLANVQLQAQRDIMLDQMKLKLNEKLVHKRLQSQIGSQQMQMFNQLKLQARQSSLDKGIGGLSLGSKLNSLDFKKMTPAQLLTSDDPRAIEAIRQKIMRKNTTVRFLAQELENMQKAKRMQNENVRSGEGTFSEEEYGDEEIGSVRTDGLPEDDVDGGKEAKDGHLLDCHHLEDEMDQLTEGDFKWSFIPVSSVNASIETDEQFKMQQQSDLSQKIKEILGQQCPHDSVRYMDDNQCIVLNFHYNKCKELQRKFQELKRTVSDAQDEQLKKLAVQINSLKYVQVSATEVVDVSTLTMKVDIGNGKTLPFDFHPCQNDLNQHYKNLRDMGGFENPLKFEFDKWSWLGNQYLKRNNYELPSWRMVMDAIVREQIVVIRDDIKSLIQNKMSNEIKKRFSTAFNRAALSPRDKDKKKQDEVEKTIEAIAIQGQTWEARFKYMALPEDLDRRIEENDFKDPKSLTVKSIFKLYSLETFLYWKLNQCARGQKEEGIDNMGCFACVLSKALEIANRYRQDQISSVITKQFVVYRGLSLTANDIQAYKSAMRDKRPDYNTINLQGYNSTSQDRNVAIGFALKNKDPNRISVMMEVDLVEGTKSGYCFVMNEDCYTRYPEECEILLDDGIPFVVVNVTENPNYQNSGKSLVVIRLESKLPKRQVQYVEEGREDIRGTLKTSQDLISFYENGSRPPNKTDDGYKPLYLSSFMTEMKDLVFGKALPTGEPTVIADEKNGHLAAVSVRPTDADPLYFEQVTEWNDRDVLTGRKAREHLGNNSFRIYNERCLPSFQQRKGKTQKGSVRRYLAVQPLLAEYRNEKITQKHDTPFVCFFPEERYASVWQFENLKTDSEYAHYIILHKQWHWIREEGLDDDELYENRSYLAVKTPGSSDDYSGLEKNEAHTYMYLTKSRSEAAVFTWKQWNHRHDSILMQETPVRWISRMLSKQEWIHLAPKETLSTDAVKNNLKYKLDEVDNAVYEISKGNERGKKKAEFVGTWSIHLDLNSIKKVGHNQRCSMRHEEFGKHAEIEKLAVNKDEVVVQMRIFCKELEHFEDASFMFKIYDRNQIVCKESDADRFQVESKLQSEVDPRIQQIVSLDQCRILREPYYKLRFVQFLEQYGISLKKMIFKITASKWKKDGKSDEDHFKEFHKKCDHKNTVVLILTEDEQIFGGYNDIGWLGKDKVSTNMAHEKKSFMFYSLKNLFDGEEMVEDDTEQLFVHKPCKGEFEIYHSEHTGPNFIDVIVQGPHESSKVRNLRNYMLEAGNITDSEKDPNGNQEFDWIRYEVFEAEKVKPKPKADHHDCSKMHQYHILTHHMNA